MPGRDIIVIGASAGGVEALVALARGLPPDLRAALFVVLHLPADAQSLLPAILSRAGPLPAAHPADGEPISSGRIYVAPPNFHLVLEKGIVRLGNGPRENRVRPAADVLFRSAARAYGPRVIGVLLSGTDGDGTSGFEAIRLRGGVTIAQEPAETAFPGMPSSAIERVGVDHVLAVAEIPLLLAELANHESGRRRTESTMPTDDPGRVRSPRVDASPLTDEKRDGRASGLTCPDCHGSIWELAEGPLVSFECRVGHRYNPDAFLGAQAARVEDALWTAVNVLHERAAALREFAARFARGDRLSAEYEGRARETEQQAAAIHAAIAGLIRSQGDAATEPT